MFCSPCASSVTLPYMKSEFAPPHIMFAALHVLHYAAYTTRNWGTDESIDRRQICDLWEAMHNVPIVLTHWRGKESEAEILLCFEEYTEMWKEPHLLGRYYDCLDTEEQ